MAGLPKKYAKMGFKKGWKAYRASKRGGTTKRRLRPKPKVKYRTRTVTVKAKRRRPSVAKKTAPRRRPRAQRGFRIGRAFTGRAAQRTFTQLGAGVGGAVGSAVVIRAIPGLTPTMRSWSQMLGSAVVMFALPRRMEMTKIALAGASLAGAFSIVKTNFPQFPLMAGECMGANFLPRGGYRRRAFQPQQRQKTIMRQPSRNMEYMGMNKNYGGPAGALMGAGAGYGKEFVTPADL